MDLTSIFSDDQLAIAGCFLALIGCGLIAAVSFHFGPAGRQPKSTIGQAADAAKAATLRGNDRRDERKAA